MLKNRKPVMGYIAIVIGALAAGDRLMPWADRDWTDASPTVLSLLGVLFVLILASAGVEMLYPELWDRLRKRKPRTASQRHALRQRRIGGIGIRSDQRLVIDREGLFESGVGMIAWSQIVGLRKVRFPGNLKSVPTLQVCVRDPWRYIDQMPKVSAMAYGLCLPRDARYGWIDILTAPYRVDLDTAYEIAMILRKQCPAPFIKDAQPSMDEYDIESTLRGMERAQAQRLSPPASAGFDLRAADAMPAQPQPAASNPSDPPR